MNMKWITAAKAKHLLMALPALLLPRHDLTSLSGDWYNIGWPLPSFTIKIGLVDMQSPVLLHFYLDLGWIITIPLWIAAMCLGNLLWTRVNSASWAVREGVRALLMMPYVALCSLCLWGVFSVFHDYVHTMLGKM